MTKCVKVERVGVPSGHHVLITGQHFEPEVRVCRLLLFDTSGWEQMADKESDARFKLDSLQVMTGLAGSQGEWISQEG